MKFHLRYLPFLLTLVLLGCGDEKPTPDAPNGDGPSEAQPVEEDLGGPLTGEPTVEVWDWEQTQEAVHQHQGKVVVLHIWALWNEDLASPDVAAPADREEKEERLKKVGFDEFVRLKKLHRDDVVAMSLNTDYNLENEQQTPESLKENVMAFAKEHGANFQHGISSVLEADLHEELDILGTPATFVYDKQGTLREKFSFKIVTSSSSSKIEWYSYRDDVIPLVEKLTKEPYTPMPKAAGDENAAEAEPPQCGEAPPSETKPAAGEATPEKKVSLELGDWDGLQAHVVKAKGRVVVVDLWSTQCVPCLKEFPNLVKLHNEKNEDVACLSFNLDYYGVGKPEELKSDVLDVLKKFNATFPNLMSKQADEQVYEKLKLASIPAVYVYDRQGKLKKRFDDTTGEFTYEKDILPLVNTLIQEKP